MSTSEMKHSQVQVGSIQLHVVEHGSGRPVLFCHGFPDVWIGWRRQMEAVAAAGYRAIAMDTRGYGRSTGPENPDAYTQFHIVGDLVGLLDALDLPTMTVVGHDFGAATAWYAAMMRPDRFIAVFGISVPYLPLGKPSVFETMEAAGKADKFYMFRQREPEADVRWADAETTYPGFLYWSSSTPPEQDRWNPFDAAQAMMRPAPVPIPPWADRADVDYAVAEFKRTGFHKPLNYYRALQPFFDLGKAFAGVTILQPSFFLTGEADGVNKMRPVDDAELRKNMPGLRGVRVLSDVGHWPHREASDTTNELLLDFLSDL
jgi:pimeloyl-ACP methyl ester carboxylesterase